MADYKDAGIACDESKSGYVRVIMNVKGLKVKKEGGLCTSKKVAKNATIHEPGFSERTVLVLVEGKNELKDKNLQLRINKLPYDIDADGCYIQPKEDRVVVFLKKADSGQSWRSYIEGNGIETDD